MATGDVNYWVGGGSGTGLSWNTGANWSLTTVPVTGEHVILRNSAGFIDTGLSQSAVLLASLTVEDTFTGGVGGAATPLAISSTLWRVEGGITRFNVNFGTNPFTGIVLAAGESVDANLATVRVKGVHASNILSVEGGDVAVSLNTPADTATVGTLNVTGGSLTVGRGTTWTAINCHGGDVTCNAPTGTTLTVIDGTVLTQGTGIIANVYAIGGIVTLSHRPASGAMVTDVYYHGGEVDYSLNPTAGTITNGHLRAATVKTFNSSHITHTNVAFDVGESTQFSFSSAA